VASPQESTVDIVVVVKCRQRHPRRARQEPHTPLRPTHDKEGVQVVEEETTQGAEPVAEDATHNETRTRRVSEETALR